MTAAVAPSRLSRIAIIGFIAAIVVALAAILAGPAYQLGLPLRTAMFGLTIGVIGGSVAAVLCLIGIFIARPEKGLRGRKRAAVGLLLSVLVVGFILSLYQTAKRVPPIHDITTDTTNPPAFEAVLAERQNAVNSPDYGGADVARQQHAAYPDIQPLVLTMTPAAALAKAEETARALDWKIVAVDPAAGRLEASDTTLWFGFTDDIVIRITPNIAGPNSGGSTLDIRSASRIGKSDIGANAERIRRFRAVFADRSQSK